MSYTQLSQNERYQIQHLHRRGFAAREISAGLKRATTIITAKAAASRVKSPLLESFPLNRYRKEPQRSRS